MLVKIIKNTYKVLDKVCGPFAEGCLAVIVLLTFGNVVLRYIFSAPIPWAEEISTLAYTFMVFFGLSITHKLGSAVGVDIVISLLPLKLKKVFDGFATLATMLLWVILCYLGVILALTSKSTFTAYLRIPYHYIYWFFPIAGFFCVIQLIYRFVMIVTGKVYDEVPANTAEDLK